MKKRDRPLVGDSPARIRVPMVGTVSLGGVVAVANGRGGLCGRPCAGPSPRNQVRGRLRRASGHRSCPRPESGRSPARRVWGWGKRDGSPQGSGRRRQRSPCGVLPGGTERPFKQSQEGGDPGSKQCTEAPLCLTSRQPLLALRQRRDVNGSVGYDHHAPPFRGRRPRRLRPETTLPGGQRIPRTAATSSVPPSSVGTRAAALPVPWL